MPVATMKIRVCHKSPLGDNMMDTEIVTRKNSQRDKAAGEKDSSPPMGLPHGAMMAVIVEALQPLLDANTALRDIANVLTTGISGWKHTTSCDNVPLATNLALIQDGFARQGRIEITRGNLCVRDGEQSFDTMMPALLCETTNPAQEVVRVFAYSHPQHTQGVLSYFSQTYLHADACTVPRTLTNTNVYRDPFLCMHKNSASFAERRKWCKIKHLQDMDELGVHVTTGDDSVASHVADGIIRCRTQIDDNVITSFFFPNSYA
jgi:hypothetical protein